MIVTEALAYLERLEAESEGDESLDLELSRAYRQIGFILGNPNTANLGNREEALKQYENARRLALPLGLKSDASAGAISNLVSVDMLIADLVKLRSGIEAGAVFTQEAVEQAQRVVRISASSPESRTLLGRALFSHAILYHPSAASIPHWERARDHYEQDLAARPDDGQHQRNVALVCKYLASALETMRDYPASLKLQRRALELDERRYLADPDNRATQFDFGVSLSAVATAMELAGKRDEAAALYSRSLDIRQRLSDSDPKDVLALSKTGYIKMRLALVEIDLGHADRARELSQASIAIQEDVLQKTKERNAQRDLSAALFTLGLAQQALAPGTSCELFARALKGFKATSPSTYLEEIQQRAERADQACHSGARATR
jgi:tetratricopeptide (TPR) repeat protein